MLEKDFKDLMVNIKREINETQVLVMSDANARLINLYFKIGKMKQFYEYNREHS